jgi:hypothetical protein
MAGVAVVQDKNARAYVLQNKEDADFRLVETQEIYGSRSLLVSLVNGLYLLVNLLVVIWLLLDVLFVRAGNIVYQPVVFGEAAGYLRIAKGISEVSHRWLAELQWLPTNVATLNWLL